MFLDVLSRGYIPAVSENEESYVPVPKLQLAEGSWVNVLTFLNSLTASLRQGVSPRPSRL